MAIYTAIEPVEAKKGRVEIDTGAGDFIIEHNVFREEASLSQGGAQYGNSKKPQPQTNPEFQNKKDSRRRGGKIFCYICLSKKPHYVRKALSSPTIANAGR